jgi:hypothetical protein
MHTRFWPEYLKATDYQGDLGVVSRIVKWVLNIGPYRVSG